MKKYLKNEVNAQGNLSYEGYPLAHDEKFRNEMITGFGTTFAVGENSIYTAAHCVCNKNSDVLNEKLIADIRIIFNVRINDNGQFRTSYEEHEIYKIKKVAAYNFIIL